MLLSYFWHSVVLSLYHQWYQHMMYFFYCFSYFFLFTFFQNFFSCFVQLEIPNVRHIFWENPFDLLRHICTSTTFEEIFSAYDWNSFQQTFTHILKLVNAHTIWYCFLCMSHPESGECAREVREMRVRVPCRARCISTLGMDCNSASWPVLLL